MVFELVKGSRGSGKPSFSLYVPVLFSDGFRIMPDTLPGEMDVSSVEIHVETFQNGYVITVRGFSTNSEAQSFFPKLRSALLWLSIRKKVGINFPKALSELTVSKTPDIENADTDTLSVAARHQGWSRVDGIYDGQHAVVYPEHKNIIKMLPPNAEMYISSPWKLISEELDACFSFDSNEGFYLDEKLAFAAQLYSTSHFEKTETVRVVQLITVIESLLTRKIKIKIKINSRLQEVLAVAVEAANDLSSEGLSDDQKKERKCFIGQLQGLKNESILRSLKQLIEEETKRCPNLGEAQDLISKLDHAYNVRSRLVHDGTCAHSDVKKANSFLTQFIPDLLEQRYTECARTD